MSGCDYSATTTVLQSLVSVDNALTMGVLVVNWDDATPATHDYNFIDMGIAFGGSDKCTVKNVWNGKTFKFKGSDVFTTESIAPHGNGVYHIKCLPF